MKIRNSSLVYFAKFIGAFCILYFGTQLVIGLAAPGGYYSPFVHDYLDYPTLLRTSLLGGAKLLMTLLGYESFVHNVHYLSMPGGRGVRMVYSCLGIGLLSFWIAFIFANRGSFKKKLAWMSGGLLMIWLINITRIALMLLAVNKNWSMPFKLDNHTLFNITAYTAIFILIWFFDRSTKSKWKAPGAHP